VLSPVSRWRAPDDSPATVAAGTPAGRIDETALPAVGTISPHHRMPRCASGRLPVLLLA
jgi:hypothetical protein